MKTRGEVVALLEICKKNAEYGLEDVVLVKKYRSKPRTGIALVCCQA
jgi:hypothetical protein